MRRSEAPAGVAIHATAVAIDGRALVIVGASRSGKSALAWALMATSCRERIVDLIGDDRVILTPRPDGEIIVRPHPRIAGFIERRGLGLVAVAHCPSALVAAVIDLGAATTRRPAWLNLPVFNIVHVPQVDRRRDLVCRWWSSVCIAAQGPHLVGKTPSAA